jgi:hypothetical protein
MTKSFEKLLSVSKVPELYFQNLLNFGAVILACLLGQRNLTFLVRTVSALISVKYRS